ncbi:VirD4-like conjugal transfer protein, CD1115 family [Lacticaseibacillus suibinensis]|uniref:VirD4-like conjugal transfer protein, CD1115 family n=1 Tax=Lacticaseibacillus suibinensis TaxID=2486011 RepID=UPI001943C8D5|nr:type IV secretory system conjugative DNA transfer family protein [Lacticaseibacillus suibinensis]
MNIDYKQWKSFLSRRDVIAGTGAFLFLISYCFSCIASHLVEYLFLSFGATLKSYNQGGIGATDMNISAVLTLHNFFFAPKNLFWLVWVVILFVTFGRVPKLLYQMRIAYRDINLGSMGTAAFTPLSDLVTQSVAVPLDDTIYEGYSGVPQVHITHKAAKKLKPKVKPSRKPGKVVAYDAIAARSRKNGHFRRKWLIPDKGYDLIDTNKTNAAVVAGTQSGKTQTFTYPVLDLIMRAKKQDSVIVTDLKGDMVRNTKAEFEKHGYDVRVFNLVTPEYSIGYNPLALIWDAYEKGDYDEAQLLCNTLSYSLFHNPNAKDPMWEEASIALTNALILAVCRVCKVKDTPKRVTMYTVSVMLNELGSNPDENGDTKMDKFFSSLEVNDPAKLQYGTITFSQGITRAGIYTGTMAKLKNYTFSAIGKLTATNDLNLVDIANGKKPVALFIVYPDYDDSNYSLISTLISQISYVLSKTATLSKTSSLDRRVKFVLEEVANIPTIEGLSRYMNVGLQRGLIYYLVFQSIAQLKDKYGDRGAEALMSACGNKYDILADGKEDAEYFSHLLGKKTIIAPNRAGDPLSLDKSYSESEQARDLMTPTELSQLKEGEWVLIRGKQRHDLLDHKIKATPIYANRDEDSQMLYQYQYLQKFNNSQTFDQLNGCKPASHAGTKLTELTISQDEFTDTATQPLNLAERKKAEPVKFEVHTSDNLTMHYQKDAQGNVSITKNQGILARAAKKATAEKKAADDPLSNQHENDQPLSQDFTDIISNDSRRFSEVLGIAQQGMVLSMVNQQLDSDDKAAFFRGNTIGNMQAFLMQHRADQPELYKKLRAIFNLEQFENEEEADG